MNNVKRAAKLSFELTHFLREIPAQLSDSSCNLPPTLSTLHSRGLHEVRNGTIIDPATFLNFTSGLDLTCQNVATKCITEAESSSLSTEWIMTIETVAISILFVIHVAIPPGTSKFSPKKVSGYFTRGPRLMMVQVNLNKKITNNLCCFWVHMKALTPLCQMRSDSLLYYGKWLCGRPKC